MKNKKEDLPITRSEFLKETESLRQGTETLGNDLRKEIGSLREQTTKLGIETMKNQVHLEELEVKVATKDDIRKVLDAIDGFAQKYETYDRKVVFHDGRIKDHEQRIGLLENPASK